MHSPNLTAPQFGEGSFERHRAVARERRLCCGVLRCERIGRDIDVARDLDWRPLPEGATTQTASLLRSFQQVKQAEFGA